MHVTIPVAQTAQPRRIEVAKSDATSARTIDGNVAAEADEGSGQG